MKHIEYFIIAGRRYEFKLTPQSEKGILWDPNHLEPETFEQNEITIIQDNDGSISEN